jgi:hypothetical protein
MLLAMLLLIASLEPSDMNTAADCAATGGTPQYVGDIFEGCVWTKSMPGGHLDLPKDCKMVGDHEECECPACGHGDDPPAMAAPAEEPDSDPARSKI